MRALGDRRGQKNANDAELRLRDDGFGPWRLSGVRVEVKKLVQTSRLIPMSVGAVSLLVVS